MPWVITDKGEHRLVSAREAEMHNWKLVDPNWLSKIEEAEANRPIRKKPSDTTRYTHSYSSGTTYDHIHGDDRKPYRFKTGNKREQMKELREQAKKNTGQNFDIVT